MIKEWALVSVLMVAVSVFAAESSDVGAPATLEKDWGCLDLPIARGDVVFIGMEDTDPALDEVDKGIEPVTDFTLSKRSKYEEMTLRIRLNLAGSGEVDAPWLFEGDVLRGKADVGARGVKYNWRSFVKVTPKDGVKPQVEKLKPTLCQVADQPVGVKMWRIPYVNVNGKARNIVVAMSQSPDALKKAIKIPKVYVFYKLDGSVELE